MHSVNNCTLIDLNIDLGFTMGLYTMGLYTMDLYTMALLLKGVVNPKGMHGLLTEEVLKLRTITKYK